MEDRHDSQFTVMVVRRTLYGVVRGGKKCGGGKFIKHMSHALPEN